jgi:hypothetical protein
MLKKNQLAICNPSASLRSNWQGLPKVGHSELLHFLPIAHCLLHIGYLERFYVRNIINTYTIFWRVIDGVIKRADHLPDGNEVLLPALLTGNG